MYKIPSIKYVKKSYVGIDKQCVSVLKRRINNLSIYLSIYGKSLQFLRS